MPILVCPTAEGRETARAPVKLTAVAAEEAGRDPGALRRGTGVNPTPAKAWAATIEQVGEAERRGADGVHVDLTYTAGPADDLLAGAEELIGTLRG